MLYDGLNKVNSWDNIISISSILKEYQKEKSDILNLLRDDPQELANLINNNLQETECQKLKHNDLFLCINCNNIKQITNDVIGEPFKIDNGEYVGESFLLTTTKIPRTYAKFVNNRLIADAFTIKTLVTWIIEYHFKREQLPHALQLFVSYVCHSHGYQLYNAPVIDNQLCPFDCFVEIENINEAAVGIMQQVVVIFNALKTLNYNHPNITPNCLFFTKKPCAYKWNNKTIQSAYTIVLGDLQKVSLTYNNIVLQVNDVKNLFVHDPPCRKMIEQKGNQIKIHCNLQQVKDKYPTTLDFYQLLVLLLNDPGFGHVINNMELVRAAFPDFDTVNLNSQAVLKDVWLYKDPMMQCLSVM